MTAQFAIRPAVDSDMDKLPDIERSAGAAFRDVPGLQWIADDDVMSAERHRELAQSGAVFVAEDGAQNVVAFISCEFPNKPT